MKIRSLLIVAPLIILALALVTGSVLILRLFSLSLLVPLLSYLWTLLGSRGITGKVKKSAERCHVGNWLEEEITVLNGSKVPKILLEVQENTDLPGSHHVETFNLSPGSSHSWQARLHCRHRGRYSLGTLTVTITDPFGLLSSHRDLGEPQNILVYPATLELPFFNPLSRNEPGQGPSRWLITESGPSAGRVREYTSGDTLNRIHWQSTAHTGKLMVKEFDPDRSNYASKNVWIIPDMHQASQRGHGDESTEEYCITIAASLIKNYLDSGKQVGLIASGEKYYLFPPETGSQHSQHLFEALALMKATGKVPIDQLISSEKERFGIGSVLIVITPFISERVAASLRQTKSRGVTVVAILLDSSSFEETASTTLPTSSLISSALQVYVIRRGDELARALDSRLLIPQMRYVGEVV